MDSSYYITVLTDGKSPQRVKSDDAQPFGVWSPVDFFGSPSGSRADTPSTEKLGHLYTDMAIHMATNARPDLLFLRHELIRMKRRNSIVKPGRVAVVEFFGSADPPKSRLLSLEELKSDLEDPPEVRGGQPISGRLYILEDIDIDHVETFGSHFPIDPSFFARHLRLTRWESSLQASSAPPLPSIMNREISFSLHYPELVIFPKGMFTLASTRKTEKIDFKSQLFCGCNLYRKIGFASAAVSQDGVGMIDRKVSYWSKKQDDKPWNALLLVDPSTTDRPVYQWSVKGLNGEMREVIPPKQKYQGGYIDFVRAPDATIDERINASRCGPPRTSIFDDIIFYLESNHACQRIDPHEPAVYAKRIAASMWITAIEHFKKTIFILENKVDAMAREICTANLDLLRTEAYAWRSTCLQYLNCVDINVTELGISFNDSQPNEHKGDCDWVYLKYRIETLTKRSNDIVQTVQSLLSLYDSHKSIEESEAAKTIQLLGTLFLPLSLMASILSLGDDYSPDKSHFWVYVVASLILIILTFMGIWFMGNFHKILRFGKRKFHEQKDRDNRVKSQQARGSNGDGLEHLI